MFMCHKYSHLSADDSLPFDSMLFSGEPHKAVLHRVRRMICVKTTPLRTQQTRDIEPFLA